MEFLYESDEDDNSKKVAVAPIKSKWTELSDNDSDDSHDEDGGDAEKERGEGQLQKADELFSSVVAQFTVNNKSRDTVDSIKPKTYSAPTPNYPVIAPEPVKKRPVAIPASDTTAGVQTSSTGSKVKGIGPTSRPPAIVDKRKDDDKDSAKDRVKRQRLAGQSGIGTDFKTWKSEEEMRQRQQYD